MGLCASTELDKEVEKHTKVFNQYEPKKLNYSPDSKVLTPNNPYLNAPKFSSSNNPPPPSYVPSSTNSTFAPSAPSAPPSAPPYAGSYTGSSVAGSSVASALPPPPSYTPENRKKYAMEIFGAFARKYNISNDTAIRIRALDNFKVIILNDDSGSMDNYAYPPKDAFDIPPTQFNELEEMNKEVINMSAILSKFPLDVYFLHRQGKKGVRDFMDVKECFSGKPRENTPIVRTLKNIISSEHKYLQENKLLVFIATDGINTNDLGENDPQGLVRYVDLLMKTYPNLHITFMACVSDENLLKVMDNMGKKHKNVGVVDEFNVEYKEQMEKHANDPNFTFTIGDFITKCLLVSVDPIIKALFNDDDSDDDGGNGDDDGDGEPG